MFQNNFLKGLLLTPFVLISLYFGGYIFVAIGGYFTPMRIEDIVISSNLKVHPGESAEVVRHIRENYSCLVVSSRKLIPFSHEIPFNITQIFSSKKTPPSGTIELPPFKRETTPGHEFVMHWAFDVPKIAPPGVYIWAVKTQYYCNIFNYIYEPYNYYPVPLYVTILPPGQEQGSVIQFPKMTVKQ